MRRPAVGWTSLLLLGLPLLAVGLWNAGLVASALSRAGGIRRDWTVVPARIEARSQVRWGRGTRSAVRYSYEVDGRRYECDRVDLYDGWPITIRFLDPDAPAEFRPGLETRARIDPSDPREAVLRPELRHAGPLLLLSLALAGPGGVCSLGALLALLADRARRRDAASGLVHPELGISPTRLLAFLAFYLLLSVPFALVAVLARPFPPAAIPVLALFAVPVPLLLRAWRRARLPWIRFARTRLAFSTFPPRPDSTFRLRLLDPAGRLPAPRLSAVYRIESRRDGEGGPEWIGRDDRVRPLAPVREDGAWTAELEFSRSPEPLEGARERRRWILRVEDGDDTAAYPLPLSRIP
jgi:hypothetical protein